VNQAIAMRFSDRPLSIAALGSAIRGHAATGYGGVVRRHAHDEPFYQFMLRASARTLGRFLPVRADPRVRW